jgi:flagellin
MIDMRISALGQPNSNRISDFREYQTRSSRLASGKRITTASDDAAGLAISERLGAQLRSLEQASRNVDHGAAVTRIADGALSSQTDNLIRMRELAMQAANGTLSNDDRAAIQSEMSALRDEVDRVGATTEFNGQPLLDGDPIAIQVGTGAGASDTITIETPDVSSSGLGLDSIDLSTQEGAMNALGALDAANESLSSARGALGAAENRLDHASSSIGSTYENTAASRSRIADANVGAESTGLAGATLRMKAAIAMQKKAMGLQGTLLSALG